MTIGAGLDAPRRAREFVAQVLTDWGGDPQIDDARLVVSELTNNAVQGGETVVTIELVRTDRGFRILVVDDLPGRPCMGTPGQDDESGRGLLLVAALCTRWGTLPLAGAKAVWAELDPSDPGSAKAG